MLLMTLPRGIHARVHAYMRHSTSAQTALQRALQQLTTRVMTSPWTLAPPLVRVRNSAEKEAVAAGSLKRLSLSRRRRQLGSRCEPDFFCMIHIRPLHGGSRTFFLVPTRV